MGGGTDEQILASDYTAGLYGALAVVAAIRHRDGTGEGQHIDLALFDVQAAMLLPMGAERDKALNDAMKKWLAEKPLGAVWGEERWKYFQGADLFCLPTHSENFGLAVLEACQVGTPALTPEQVGLVPGPRRRTPGRRSAPGRI